MANNSDDKKKPNLDDIITEAIPYANTYRAFYYDKKMNKKEKEVILKEVLKKIRLIEKELLSKLDTEDKKSMLKKLSNHYKNEVYRLSLSNNQTPKSLTDGELVFFDALESGFTGCACPSWCNGESSCVFATNCDCPDCKSKCQKGENCCSLMQKD